MFISYLLKPPRHIQPRKNMLVQPITSSIGYILAELGANLALCLDSRNKKQDELLGANIVSLPEGLTGGSCQL